MTEPIQTWGEYFYDMAQYGSAGAQDYLEEEGVAIFFFQVNEVDIKYFPELAKFKAISVYKTRETGIHTSTWWHSLPPQLEASEGKLEIVFQLSGVVRCRARRR